MKGAVVVTGASTGIGASIARKLVADGFEVFGTVRRAHDAQSLEREGVRALTLDVTDGASVAAACEQLERVLGDRPLVALVNNAGIAAGGALELLSTEKLRRVLEVNVIGVVAMTQALLPALRRGGGRVVNISSVSGRLAMPFGGPYSASKFALEAISDCMRRELITSGIKVVVIQPGSVATPIWDKSTQFDLQPYDGTPYESAFQRALERIRQSGQRGMAPEVVADAVLRALSLPKPPPRMLVSRTPWMVRLMRLLPDRWVDRMIVKQLWGRR